MGCGASKGVEPARVLIKEPVKNDDPITLADMENRYVKGPILGRFGAHYSNL
jgi:hypothetical protein